MFTKGRFRFHFVLGLLAARSLAAEAPYLVLFKPNSAFGHDAAETTPLFPGARFVGDPMVCTRRQALPTGTRVHSIRLGMMSREVANLLRTHPDVEMIEESRDGKTAILTSQTNLAYPPPYPLPRISHTIRSATNYQYDSSAGQGTCIFVVDSGYTNHSDFNGRFFNGGSFFSNDTLNILSQGLDELGHGTHVAGTGKFSQ